NDVWIIPMSFIAVATLGWFAPVSRASLAIGVLVLLPWVLWELRIILMHDVLLRRRQIYAIITGGFALALLVLWFAGAPESIAERVERPAEGYGRLDLWAATWQGLLDSKFIGLGLGGANVALEMGLQDVATRKAPGWTHNDWLQYVSDLGILGAVLSAIWLVGFAAAIRKTTVSSATWWISRRHLIDRAFVVGVASVLIHSLVDFPLRIPLVGFCFLALMAVLLARLNSKESAPKRAA
ncbi:MAG: O-antigen ligase family protein, partial [Candidatus Sumerlaeia bacterium]|nr:O-antigen ligase family protein [Candidatus Sumerlaeia bacterium]